MRVHIVTQTNRHLYLAELDAFFRARHDIYVHEKRWRDPSASGLEIDQFDHGGAAYLIGFEDDGTLVGGTRLIPSSQPHMLSEVFAAHCDLEPMPRRTDVAEWTRAFVVPRFRRERLRVVYHACAAVMRYCLDEGVTQVGGLQECYWLPLWSKLGWNVRVLGRPREIAGDTCVAAYMDVTEAAFESACKRAGIEAPTLVQRGPHRPFQSLAVVPAPVRTRENLPVAA